MGPQTHKYRVISLDVWGHGPGEHEEYDCDGECDGYTVNDAHTCGEIEVIALHRVYNAGTPQQFDAWETEDADLVKALVDGGFLSPGCAKTPEKIEIEGEPDGLLFVNLDDQDDPEDGKPLLQLARVED